MGADSLRSAAARAACALVAWAALHAPVLACTVSVGGLAFGPYNPLGRAGAVTTSGTITVACDTSPAPNVTVMISPSAHSGTYFPRMMRQAGSGETLHYNLYVDTSASIVWGDGRPGTGTRTDRVFKGRPWTMTIYALVPPGQNVTPGVYSDSIGVSILF